MTAASTADLEALRSEAIQMNRQMQELLSTRMDTVTTELQTVPGRVQGEIAIAMQTLRGEFAGMIDGRAQVIERLIAMLEKPTDNNQKSRPFKPETLLCLDGRQRHCALA